MPKHSATFGQTPSSYPNTPVNSPQGVRPLTKESLPAEFQAILTRIGRRFGVGLRVNVTDSAWVEISVDNLPAKQLHAQLQLDRKSLFGTAESRMQVIQPLQSTAPVIHLHMLNEPNWGDRTTMALRGKK